MGENQAAVETRVVSRPVGKVRSPLAVILLGIVTLGIYSIVWQYCVFEELKNWRGQGWSGVLFLILFLFVGVALIVVPWLIPAYIGRMYVEDGQPRPISGWSGFWCFVPIIGGIIWIFKVQNRLNEFWRQKK